MKKNNLCLLLNFALYEETDSFSQSNFNPNKSLYDPLKKTVNQIKRKDIDILENKIGQLHNKYDVNIYNKISKKYHIGHNKKNNILKDILFKIYERLDLYRKKHQKNFELNYCIFGLNYIINKYKTNDKLDKDYKEYIDKFYSYNDSILIIPKKEFYYFHHMLFLERPNYINYYFNKLSKKIGIEKLNIYQNQRKKEYKIEQSNNKKDKKQEIENEKIFDTNVLETIENYSTTITQEPINEKPATLTPFEILKRCEDKKKKKILKNNNDQKSIITFSESEISYISRNIPDESLITVVKDLTEKPNKFKIDKQEKKYTNIYIKKKNTQKFTRTNKNNNIKVNNNINLNKNIKNNNNNLKLNSNKNNNINNIYDINNEEKEMIIKKTVSTSKNKKTKKKIIIDIMYQNTISKSSSKKESFINKALSNKCEENLKKNFTAIRKNKGVLNLKKQSFKIKTHTSKLSDNIKENSNINNIINNNTNSKLVLKNNNDLDKLLNFFLTPKNKNPNQNNNNDKARSKYAEFNYYNIKKRQNKKNTTLNFVNNNIINNSLNSQEKYQKMSNCKSKSPLTRIFLKKNNYASNCKRNYKKKKSVLIPEFKHSQATKSLNKYLEKKKDENKNISSYNISNNNKHHNIMALGTNGRNSYLFMKLNKHVTKK